MNASAAHVCRRCSTLLRRQRLRQIQNPPSTRPLFTQSRRRFSPPITIPNATLGASIKPITQKGQSSPQFWGNDVTISSADNGALVQKAQSMGNVILNSQSIPSEEDVLKAFELIKYAALQIHGSSLPKSPNAVDDLLDAVSPGPSASSQTQKVMAVTSTTINLLSSLAYRIIIHPPVFITPKILETYLAVQLALQRPSSFPEVFDLYSNKPVPVPDSSPIVYKDSSPSKPSQAIPQNLADQALECAIREKNLTLALDIIDSAYATRAYRRNRFIRKALPTVSGIALTPIAAIPLAHAWAETSNAADPQMLFTYTWVGILTYVSSVSGLGYVAITTYNDQMERVTWLPGTYLRDRWLREDERAAADKVALAWGFKDRERRGEEEGDEWELLKEWCGRRGMVLDATELMEGME
jgi:hypothetical protein